MVSRATCPICHRAITQPDGSVPETMPFCSVRCRQVDFYRWTTGKYAIVEDLSPDRLANELFQNEDSDLLLDE